MWIPAGMWYSSSGKGKLKGQTWDISGVFCAAHTHTHTHTQSQTHTHWHTGTDQTDAIWESPMHSAMVSFNSPRSFHLFILGQEYLYSVCTVSPQIKHSLCIPYEMYLLRFGRGGRQVLGYSNWEGPPFPSLPLPHWRGHCQAAQGEHDWDRKQEDLAFKIKAEMCVSMGITEHRSLATFALFLMCRLQY